MNKRLCLYIATSLAGLYAAYTFFHTEGAGLVCLLKLLWIPMCTAVAVMVLTSPTPKPEKPLYRVRYMKQVGQVNGRWFSREILQIRKEEQR